MTATIKQLQGRIQALTLRRMTAPGSQIRQLYPVVRVGGSKSSDFLSRLPDVDSRAQKSKVCLRKNFQANKMSQRGCNYGQN